MKTFAEFLAEKYDLIDEAKGFYGYSDEHNVAKDDEIGGGNSMKMWRTTSQGQRDVLAKIIKNDRARKNRNMYSHFSVLHHDDGTTTPRAAMSTKNPQISIDSITKDFDYTNDDHVFRTNLSMFKHLTYGQLPKEMSDNDRLRRLRNHNAKEITKKLLSNIQNNTKGK